MRIPAPCCICVQDQMTSSGEIEGPIVFSLGRVSNKGFVRVRCSKGHESIVLYNERKHDLLFRSACHTLIAGYEREAISSFAAAMERTYEFFIRVVARHYEINGSAFESSWNSVSKQSERQLGMFLGFHCLLTDSAYELDEKMVNFRNKVIHQGYIPDEDETHAYGSHIFDKKLQLTEILSGSCKDAVAQEVEAEMNAMNRSAPQDIPRFPFEARLVGVDTNTNTAHDFTNFGEYIAALREKPTP